MRAGKGFTSFVFLLFLFTGGSLPLWAQDDLAYRAETFREQLRDKSSVWQSTFLQALLGQNHEEAAPKLSKALQDVVSLTSRDQLPEILAQSGKSKKEFYQILKLAQREAEVWQPGKIVQRETIQDLYQILWRGPPEEGQAMRLEAMRHPSWEGDLIPMEQIVNDKIARLIVNASDDTLPSQLDPKNQPRYWLPHVEIPIEEARIYHSDLIDADVASQIIREKDGRVSVVYFLHPGSQANAELQALVKTHPIQVEYLATPTASPRSLIASNLFQPAPHLWVKASLDAMVGTLRRINPTNHALRASIATRALDGYYLGKSRDGFLPYLREPIIVYPGDRKLGMMIREADPDLYTNNGSQWIPGQSLVSKRDGKEPILVEMIRNSGEDPVKFVRENILRPYMKLWGEITFQVGLVGQHHQQNVLLEMDPTGRLTRRLKFRDLDSFRPDLELMVRRGLPVGHHLYFTDTRQLHELMAGQGRKYYDTSFYSYVSDWSYLLGNGLGSYFSNMDSSIMQKELIKLLGEELERHLGKKARGMLKKGKSLAEIMAVYRTEEAYKAPHPSEWGVEQSDLREEFERLQTNKRVTWFAGERTAQEGETYFLHHTAIELRDGGHPRALAFLETPGVLNFYEGSTSDRREPEQSRLKNFFAPFSIVEARWQARRATMRNVATTPPDRTALGARRKFLDIERLLKQRLRNTAPRARK